MLTSAHRPRDGFGRMHEAPGCRCSFHNVGIRRTCGGPVLPRADHHIDQSIRRRGPADLLARTVADGMSETLGRPVVVENRPGAGTAIGARAVAQASPDGYSLFLGGSPSHVITPALMKDANYDGIKDFTPITTVANVPNVLVVRRAAPPEREGSGRRCQGRQRQDDICFDRRRQHSAVFSVSYSSFAPV